MTNKGTLLAYFDDTILELKTSKSINLVPFEKGAEEIIAKHNNTKQALRRKLSLADFHFVNELKQKILLDLQALKLTLEGVPSLNFDIYHSCTIKIDANASLEELVKRGKYSVWGRNYNSEKYPKPNWEVETLDLLIINFNTLAVRPYKQMVQKVTKKFAALGRFAGIYELAHLGWQYPDLQKRFIELYGLGSQFSSFDEGFRMELEFCPCLTYSYEDAGAKVRGFYTKNEVNMMYDHNFCSTGFVMIKK